MPLVSKARAARNPCEHSAMHKGLNFQWAPRRASRTSRRATLNSTPACSCNKCRHCTKPHEVKMRMEPNGVLTLGWPLRHLPSVTTPSDHHTPRPVSPDNWWLWRGVEPSLRHLLALGGYWRGPFLTVFVWFSYSFL